jgi:hypothetical protein
MVTRAGTIAGLHRPGRPRARAIATFVARCAQATGRPLEGPIDAC